jgi:RimJ/RimL family protein N-acetyltransferase
MIPHCPTLTTERLILRSPTQDDAENVIAFLTDPVRTKGFGGEMSRNDAWRWFASLIGHWYLRGYGFWMIDSRDGDALGFSGLWYPEGWPEPELGWVLFAGAEGHGYATEAALAIRNYAYDVLKMPALTSNIVPSNEASKAVARRLGAVMERVYENPHMGTDELWRHPGPEARVA